MTIEVSGDPYITVKYSERSVQPQVIIYEGRVNVRGRDIVVIVDGTIVRDGVTYDRALFTSHAVSGNGIWYASFGNILDPDYHIGNYHTEEIPHIVRDAVQIFTDYFEK